MGDLTIINEGNHSEKMEGNVSGPSGSHATNILINHDFSDGLNARHPNYCHGYVVSSESGYQEAMTVGLDGNYAVITDRRQCWQGLEQDITDKIFVGSTCMVSAFVGVYGLTPDSTHVKAILKLERHGSDPIG